MTPVMASTMVIARAHFPDGTMSPNPMVVIVTVEK
jgi:hypothetical protein